jgi:hypothetical protein
MTPAHQEPPPPQTYVYRWNRMDRKGQLCRVTARGTMNSCRVEFDDGFVMITSRNALKKAALATLSAATQRPSQPRRVSESTAPTDPAQS